MGAEYLSCYNILVFSPLYNPCSALSENTLYSPSTTAFTVVLVQKYFRLAPRSLSRAQCALDILSYLFDFFRFFLAGIFEGNSPISSHHIGNYVSFSSLVCFFVRSSFNGNVVMCFRNWLHSPLQPLLMYYFLHAFYHFFDSREI